MWIHSVETRRKPVRNFQGERRIISVGLSFLILSLRKMMLNQCLMSHKPTAFLCCFSQWTFFYFSPGITFYYLLLFLIKNGVTVSHEMDQCKAVHWVPSAFCCQTSIDFDSHLMIEGFIFFRSQKPRYLRYFRPVMPHRNFVGDGYVLFNIEATGHRWLLDTWNVASETEE